MSDSVFLTRAILRNYKSIGYCDVHLQPLTFLVGANGSGKSNFLDALHLVRDALSVSLDHALNERGGLPEVQRRSSGQPRRFAIRLEFVLPGGESGHYAFNIGAVAGRGYEVLTEQCVVAGAGRGPCYRIERGKLKFSTEKAFPAVTADRLALVALSGLTAFRPVFDALATMGFYSFNPRLMRELHKPQDGRWLKAAGENIASAIGHLDRVAPERMAIVREYLSTVVPMVKGVERKRIGPMETLEFRQESPVAKRPVRFLAHNMSDGTLRALGVLTALFQGNRDYAPSLVGIEEPETALHPVASAALREALARASKHTQVIVTSHSPDLVDDRWLSADSLLAVIFEGGETRMAPINDVALAAMRDQLYSPGDLLRRNRLSPDPTVLAAQAQRQADLFGECER